MSTQHVYNYPDVKPGVWTRVLYKFAVLPWASITVTSNLSQFEWKIIGAGPPFLVVGGPQQTLNAPVGWAGPYVEVLVKPQAWVEPQQKISIKVIAKDMF